MNARRTPYAISVLLLVLLPTSMRAQATKPMDQFQVIPIPFGIDLQPQAQENETRILVFNPSDIARNDVLTFVQTMCRNAQAQIETLEPSWLQWFRGEIPAKAIC